MSCGNCQAARDAARKAVSSVAAGDFDEMAIQLKAMAQAITDKAKESVRIRAMTRKKER